MEENSTLSQIIGSIYDLGKNYSDMQKDNTKLSDKYFHCKANFDATRRGPVGEKLSRVFCNIREILNSQSNGFRKGISKEDSNKDTLEDLIANEIGRQNAKNMIYCDSKDGCKQFRVNGINEKY